MPHSDSVRELLQEVGGPPEVPTPSRFHNLVARMEPERLEAAKTQLKEVLKRKNVDPLKLVLNDEPHRTHNELTDINGVQRTVCSDPSQVSKTHILEMELLKLKGQFHKNKANTLNLIKKLSNEREMVKDSIKELSTTRKEELDLVEAIKKDNLELMQRKHQLEWEVLDLTKRLELAMDCFKETETSLHEKEQKLMDTQMEKLKLSKHVEILELKLSSFEKQQQSSCCSFDWNSYSPNIQWPLCLRNLILICLVCIVVPYLYFSGGSADLQLSEPICNECDYERDIYTKIKV